jgi:hypothetical protein
MSPAKDSWDSNDLAAKKLARRLYRALKRNDQTAYIGEFDPSIPWQRTVIDGRFNLVRVAHYLLSDPHGVLASNLKPPESIP